jgi:putative addiction module killer protein
MAGDFSQLKGVGSGVFEFKIDFGPGYRIYFGKDGDTLVILIGGGTNEAPATRHRGRAGCWTAYKRRKKQELQ